MTKDELIEYLSGLDLPGDTPIILAKDGEGNGFSPLSDSNSSNLLYGAESTWAGEVYDPEEEDGWDIPDDAVPAIVLWPVN